MIPILDDQGRKTKATALTALVVRATESETVQVGLRLQVAHIGFLYAHLYQLFQRNQQGYSNLKEP